jgi:hypothetical protein
LQRIGGIGGKIAHLAGGHLSRLLTRLIESLLRLLHAGLLAGHHLLDEFLQFTLLLFQAGEFLTLVALLALGLLTLGLLTLGFFTLIALRLLALIALRLLCLIALLLFALGLLGLLALIPLPLLCLIGLILLPLLLLPLVLLIALILLSLILLRLLFHGGLHVLLGLAHGIGGLGQIARSDLIGSLGGGVLRLTQRG